MKIKLLITDEAKWVAYGPCRVVQVFGNNNHTADNYIQFHEKPLASLAAADVPAVASIFAPASAPFDWKPVDPICLSELTIAVSSTNVNYTALTNQGVDATVIVETDFPVGADTTLVGDLTTNVSGVRSIWDNSTGPKRLLQLSVKNGSGGTLYAHLFAQDTGSIGDDTQSLLSFSVGDGLTVSKYFGRDGFRLLKFDPTERDGCTVKFADGAEVNSHNFNTGTSYIRAVYE